MCTAEALRSVALTAQNEGVRVDQQHFRKAVGSFVTGVTVLTAVDASGRRWGMTANSFSSVSLDPSLISICVGRRTGSFEVFNGCDRFGISILANNQQDLAMRFATPLDDKFDGVALRESEWRADAPTLSGAAAWLECRVHSRIVAGDHVILIGHVEACGSSGRPALGYFRGTFFDLTPPVDTGPERHRRVTTGWLIEDDGGIVLRPAAAGDGRWTLPTSPMRHAANTADSLVASAREALGGEVAISFLYSVLDDPDEDATCFVYRGNLANGARPPAGYRSFALDDLPWDGLMPHLVELFRRYVEERSNDRYGLFLSVGPGRIAAIDERDWASSRPYS